MSANVVQVHPEAVETRKIVYRPEIDGLRAFAVIAVIINHFNQDLLPGGYLGVDIFFVISGYVITASLANQKSTSFLNFLTSFYGRRVKRLLPTLIVFVLVTSVLISLFNPEPKIPLGLGWRALFGFSNISLYQTSTDYFAQAAELNPYTHTWSLGVEEQFYLLFPFLIWFTGFRQQNRNGARNLFLLAGALSIASLLSFIYLYQTNQPAAYFLMPSRFWEMAAGCLIFIGLQKRARLEQVLEQMPPLLVLAALIVLMFLPVSQAVPATIAIVFLAAVLIACLKKGTPAHAFFTQKKIVYIGLISYSLYVWHWGVLCISRWTIGIHWWTVPLQIVLLLGIAIGSYRYIEQPFRRGGQQIDAKVILFFGLVASTAVFGFVRVVESRSRWFYQLANPHLEWFDYRDSAGRVYKTWVLKEAKSTLPAPVYKESTHLLGCMRTGEVSRKDLEECLGAGKRGENEKGRIFIIGDSHADVYTPAMRAAFPDRSVTSYTAGWSCSYLPHAKAITLGKYNYFKCLDYVQNIDAFVARYLLPGDLVVLGMDWRDKGGKKGTPGLPATILSLAQRVTSSGASFALLDDVPALGEPLVCQKTWYRPFPPSGCIKSLAQVKSEQSALDEIGRQVTALNKSTKYVSLRSNFCDHNQRCSIYLNRVQIFRDNGHITKDASIRYATQSLKQELSPLLAPVSR